MFIRLLCVLFFSVGITYIAYQGYYNYKDKKDNREIQNIVGNTESINQNSNKSDKIIELETLHKENSDIIGWIEIENTNINYPVLQTNNNDFYLTHNYKKEYSPSGSLFLDKNFDLDKPSSNYLIYGHRNKNGLMFEDLINYKDKNYYTEHPIINFTTLKEDSEYEIISVFLSRVYYKNETNVFRYYFFVDAENEQEYNNYVSNCLKSSLYDIGKNAEYGEQLLTLSTCEYSQEDGRLVVVAKKIE
mgnify:FL=1